VPTHPSNFPIRMVAVLDLSSVSFVGIRNTKNKMVYDNLVGIAIYKEFSDVTGHYVALVGEREDCYHIIDDDKIDTRHQPITRLAIGKSVNSQFNTRSSLCVYE